MGSTEMDDILQELRSLRDEVRQLHGLLRIMSEVVGECRVEAPFKAIYPVLDEDGLHWCCKHDSVHRSEVVVSLKR